MYTGFYKELYSKGLLSEASFDKLSQPQRPPDLSVHWEVRTLLYIGVVLLTGGLGLAVYENIDTIGHTAVLTLIGLIAGGCFFYCFKTTKPFSRDKVNAPNAWFDYILLLGSISMVSFIGYWQYQYTIFGTNYGLATLVPMLVLFFTAYYFDHLGILSMAIASLAVWMGVSVTPKALLLQNDFDKGAIINTYILLAIMLLVAAFLSDRFQFKKHFKFSYQHYGVHAGYIALLAGYFHYFDGYLAAGYMMALFALSAMLYLDAKKHKSFYFLLLMTLYTYFALSCLVMRVLVLTGDIGALYLAFFYFIGSALALVFLLIHFNKKLKTA